MYIRVVEACLYLRSVRMRMGVSCAGLRERLCASVLLMCAHMCLCKHGCVHGVCVHAEATGTQKVNT